MDKFLFSEICEQVKVFGTVKVLDSEWKHFIKIGDKTAAAAAH